MKPETDPQVILKLLETKGRASASELGTTKAIMEQLQKKELVRPDGFIKTGKRGKPPIAYVLEDGKTYEDAPEELDTPKPKKQKEETLQAAIDRELVEIKKKYVNDCTCIVELQAFPAADIKRYEGCKRNYICSALDELRRHVL